jgi:hypothetical protein
MNAPAVAAFGGDPVGPAAVVLAARLPEPRAGLQHPLLPIRGVRLVKPAVGIPDAHERRSPPKFLLDQDAIGCRFFALDRNQVT